MPTCARTVTIASMSTTGRHALSRVVVGVALLASIQAAPAHAANNGWSTVNSQVAGRAFLAAATAPDGRVYIIGGSNVGLHPNQVSTAEVFDPVTGQTSPLPPLPQPRDGLAAAVGKDGRVYVFGGADVNRTPVAEVDSYDPAARTWTHVTDLPHPRQGLAAAAGLDGKIYTFGGEDDTGLSSAVDILDPSCLGSANPCQAWSGSLITIREPRALLAAATASDGRIYVLGGIGAHGPLPTVDVFDTGQLAWSTAAPLPEPRYALAAVASGPNRVYALGGVGQGSTALDTFEVYLGATDTWSTLPQMPSARDGLAAAAAPDGRILAIGGRGAAYPAGIDVYTPPAVTPPAPGGWVTGAPLPTGREGMAAVAAPDGQIYVLGGFRDSDGTPLATVEAYRLSSSSAAGAWVAIPPMPTPRAYLAAAYANGRIYAIGGATGAYQPIPEPTDAPIVGATDGISNTPHPWPSGYLLTGTYGITYAWRAHGGTTLTSDDAHTSAFGEVYVEEGQYVSVSLPPFPPDVTGADIYLAGPGLAEPKLVTTRTDDTEFLITQLPARDAPNRPLTNTTGAVVDTVEAYDLQSQTWLSSNQDPATLAPLPFNAWGMAAVADSDGKILTFSGSGDQGSFAGVLVYDPATNTWTDAGGESGPTRVLAAATRDAAGHIYLLGGNSGTSGESDDPAAGAPSSGAWLYDETARHWTALPPMLSPRQGLAAASGGDGRIYAIGGSNLTSTHLGSVEAFDNASNTWTAVAPMSVPRRNLAAAADECGDHLIAFGGNSGQPPDNAVEIYTIGGSTSCDQTVQSAAWGSDAAWSSTTSTLFGIDEGIRSPQVLADSGATWQRVVIPWAAVQPTSATDFSQLGQTLPGPELRNEVQRGLRQAGLLQFTP